MNWENDSMERTCRKQLVKLLKKKTRMQIISLKMRRNLHPDCGCVHYVHACMNVSQVREVRTMKDNSYNSDHLYLKWFKEFE